MASLSFNSHRKRKSHPSKNKRLKFLQEGITKDSWYQFKAKGTLKKKLPNCIASVYRVGIFSLHRVLTLQIQNKSLEKWCQNWGVGNDDDALRSASAQRAVRLHIHWQEYSRSQAAGFATWTIFFFFSLRKEVFWKPNYQSVFPVSIILFSG